MKILVVSQYFWPENFRVNELVRDLCSRGHLVSVLTGVPNYPSGKVDPCYRSNPSSYSNYHGARIYRCWIIPRGSNVVQLIFNYLSFALSASIYALPRLFFKTFDVVFVYQLSPLTLALPAILISRLKKVPLVFWVQDLWPDTLISLNIIQNKHLASLAYLLSSLLYNQAHLILAQSRSFVRRLSSYTKNNLPIYYFPNWSDFVSPISTVSPAPELPPEPDCFTILFAGNIGEAQDFPSILNAAQLLPCNLNIRWAIVGSGSQSDWLQAQITELGLSRQFRILGRFPYERMPSFFKSADALILSLAKKPAFSLTIPSKLQAYLSSGLPILGMLDGEGAQTILNSQAGFVCSAGDSSGLAANVQRLMGMSPEARRQMGALGLAFARSEFSKSQLLDELDIYLDDIAST